MERLTSGAGGDVDPVVLLEWYDENLALIRLNRPQARNSLTFGSWRGIAAALTGVIENPELRGIVIAGADGFFSAGGDVKSLPAEGFRALAPAARVDLGHRVISVIRSAPVPVIAAIEGAAIGAGWSLAWACDLIVASGAARFSAPFVGLGVVPDGAIAWFLTQRAGRHLATEILLGATTIDAARAFDLNLINRLVAPGEAEGEALCILRSLPRSVPQAVELTKALIDQAENDDLPAFMRAEVLSATLTQLGPEARDARALAAARRKGHQTT